MAGVIQLPQRFLTQPQYAAPIDYQGLGKGAQIAFNPALGPVDLVTKRVWTPSGNASVATGQYGKVFSFDGTDDYYSYTGYSELSGSLTGTFALWLPTVGPTDTFGHVYFYDSNAVYFQVEPSGYIDSWGAQSAQQLTSWFNTTNRSIVFVKRGNLNTDLKVYVDGIDIGFTWPGAGGAFIATSKKMWLGSSGVNWDVSGSMLSAFLTTSAWGAAEAKAFHDSKGAALFKAPSRRIWVASAASGDGVGSASGTSTVSGTGASINAQPGTSAGTATVSGVGASTAASVGSASGSASVSGTGAADASSVGTVSGVATVSGVGSSSTAGSSGSATGTSTVSGVGSSVAESVGSSSGVGAVSGVGSSVAESAGSSSGLASVSGVGDYSVAGSSVGTASGASTVSGVGASVVSAAGTSSGTSSVLGVSEGGSPEREAGGDDYPLIVREKRRKKTLAEQPNKHLESIFEKAVKEVLGEEESNPILESKENKELEKKRTVLVATPKPDAEPVSQEVIDGEAEKVAALLAQYQEHVRLAGMHEDEELMLLLMEAF